MEPELLVHLDMGPKQIGKKMRQDGKLQSTMNHRVSGMPITFITPYPSESQRAKCFVVAPGQLLTTRDRQAVEMPSTQSIAGRQPKPTSTRANCTPPSECITCDWVAKVSAANQTGLVLAYWPIGYLGLAPRLPKLSKPFNAYQRSVGAPRGR